RSPSFARSLFAAARPSASILNSKSEYLRRNNSASSLDCARLLVNTLSDSWSMDSCRRICSFCVIKVSAVPAWSAFSILDSDKELFPSAASLPTGSRPTNMIIDPRVIAHLGNRKSKIENRKFKLLGHLRRVGAMFLEHPCRRKLTELVTDHVLGDEDGVKGLSVVYQKRVADKIRRHHRTPRPCFDRSFCARTIHLVDLPQKMRLDEGSFLQRSSHKLQMDLWRAALCKTGLAGASLSKHHAFFFDFLRSKMNRSLGLCLLRVLNPLASCPQGLTG